MKKIIFYYPSRVVGGAEILFARLSSCLTVIFDEIIVIDYKDGVYSQLINNKSVKIVSIDDSAIMGTTNTVIIMPPVNFHKLPTHFKIDKNVCFVFWMLHPFNLLKGLVIHQKFKCAFFLSKFFLTTYNRIIFRKHGFFVRRLIDEATEENGFFFMDGETFNINKELFRLNSQPKFIPIPITTDIKLVTVRERTDTINIACIGRIDDFKVEIIKYFVNDLSKLEKSNTNFKIHIIGSGPLESELKQFCGKYNMSFLFTGSMKLEELHHYLIENINCVFAMGTSALEAALLGIPTCLFDAAYGKINFEYKYKWIFDTTDFVLGRILDIKQNHPENKEPLEKIIENLLFDYSYVSNRCRQYALENHNIDDVTERLVNAVNQSTFTYQHLGDILHA